MTDLTSPPKDNQLLILDDDENFLKRLLRIMERRGFNVLSASSIREAHSVIALNPITHAILDLRLEDGNGLDIVEALHEKQPDARILVLTGYGTITTAVAAVKMGAVEYLAKPLAEADDIYAALMGIGNNKPEPPTNPMSADQVKWEHIQRVFEQCDRNVSETARRLNMHRRTLQRILSKRAPVENRD